MSRPARKKFRTQATSLSFPPRSLLVSCFRHVCHMIQQGSYPRMPLFVQFFMFAEVHLKLPFG